MKRFYPVSLVVVFLYLNFNLSATNGQQAKRPSFKISMGSCNKQTKSQDYFQHVLNGAPDLWLWLGDNIYADHYSNSKRQQAYSKVKRSPYYQKLRQATKVSGIWDDHDYAYDNADINYYDKTSSKNLFFDFLELPAQHIAHTREGIYRVEQYQYGQERIEIYLLDTRSFYDKEREQLLGDEQWAWLEDGIENSTADTIIVASGIAIINFSASWLGLEGWSAFKQDRHRLYQLLEQTHAKVVLLSGDRHQSDVSQKTLDNGKEIFEVMASGLTHTSTTAIPNFNRVGKAITEVNFAELIFEGKNISVAFRSAKSGKILERIDLY